MIEVSELRYRYAGARDWALDGVSLRFADGAIHGLLGPNGAGKSTLLGLLLGLRAAQQGTIEIHGSRLSYCPQDFSFYPMLTGRENLAFFGGVQGLQGSTLQARIHAAIDLAALDTVADRRADTYSGGLKRRLNLAIACVAPADWLLLDEPTVGVDPQSRRFILDAIRRLPAQGTSVLYTSHYMEEVQELCENVAILDRGRVLADAPLATLLAGDRGLHIDLMHPLSDSQWQAVRGVWPAAERTGLRLRIPAPLPAQSAVLARLESAQIAVVACRCGYRNLEDLFFELTERGLRD
jgi:ABC-2 type transport system ATP-binding protein